MTLYEWVAIPFGMSWEINNGEKNYSMGIYQM